MIFQIDNYQWNIQASIKRTAELRASEISGFMLDGSYFNDVMGLYMNYSVRLEIPVGMEKDYADLYEILTEPVDGHRCIFPYNQDTIDITARIQNVTDGYFKKEKDNTVWFGIAFSVTANHPTKMYTLKEVLTRGLTALPPETKYEVGTVIELTENGWQELNIENANDKEY